MFDFDVCYLKTDGTINNKTRFRDASLLLPKEQKIQSLALFDQKTILRKELDEYLQELSGSIAFGIGSALAELDGQIGKGNITSWLKAPKSAVLLPSSNPKKTLSLLESFMSKLNNKSTPLTIKYKVAVQPNTIEESVVNEILDRLPSNGKLRLDANGGWTRNQANDWADLLHKKQKIECVEQPLPSNDIEGLTHLAMKIPVALDETLLEYPHLIQSWRGWQIRRPLLEGDPRILLKELKNQTKYRAISTTFETGIGLRWVHHLAALQQRGPTPTAPGLAPGWCPDGPLFSQDPQSVWEAA